MKKTALFVALLACCLALQAEVTAEEAIRVLSASVNKFAQAKGLSMKLSVKVPVAPAFDIDVFSKGDLFAMAMEGNKVFFRDDTLWDYDVKENTVEVQKVEKNKLGEVAQLGTLPMQIELKNVKPLGKNSIEVDGAAVKFDENDGMITFYFKSKEGNMDMTVNSRSENVSQLKLKKGVLALSINYKSIKYTCADKDVAFDAANYPGVQIINK